MTTQRTRPLALALVAALAAVACTNELTPTGDEVLVRVEVSGAGVVQSVTADLVPAGRHTYAEPTDRGQLQLEVLNGDDVTWSGHRYVPYFRISEDFSDPTAIVGGREPIDAAVHTLVFPDDGREEIPLRLSVVGPDGGVAQVTEHVLSLPRDQVAAGASPLIEINDDVAGRREGLCIGPFNNCDEPREFCSGFISACIEEACVPDDTWDGDEVELVAGSDLDVLFIPVGWDDPAAFEDFVSEMVEQLHSRVDWYSENEGRIGFSVWRQACSYGESDPDPGDRGAILEWLWGLEPWTVRLPDADKIIAIGSGESCGGVTTQLGRHVSMTQCADIGTAADVLAHELGHSVAGLLDEYGYSDDLVECEGDDAYAFNSPNLADRDDPSWFCTSDAGEIYAGQACGGVSGGVVGAFVTRASVCSNDIARPCENSIMNLHWGNQFDPVGSAAMSYVLDSGGAMMGYEDCDAGCSTDCGAFGAGECGLNGCNQICDGCDTGERCGGAPEIGYLCREMCDPATTPCRSNLGFEFCHGTTGLTTDGSCMGYRVSMCDNGRVVPGACVI